MPLQVFVGGLNKRFIFRNRISSVQHLVLAGGMINSKNCSLCVFVKCGSAERFVYSSLCCNSLDTLAEANIFMLELISMFFVLLFFISSS